jgi:hypothetical protein
MHLGEPAESGFPVFVQDNVSRFQGFKDGLVGFRAEILKLRGSALWLAREGGSERDPSLRLKGGSAQDDNFE